MKLGTLYGIGVGPGDPDLITVKGAAILAQCRHVFVPKARTGSTSTTLEIVRKHIRPDAKVEQLVFPMTKNPDELRSKWEESAQTISLVLQGGEDACFLTLGDTLLYSTYIYLVRALHDILPNMQAVTVPGITSFSAAAAISGFPLGEGKDRVSIVPASDELSDVEDALSAGGTVVIMKVGRRLGRIIELLDRRGLVDNSVFVSRAGMPNQRVEFDLRKLRGVDPEVGNLSVILVHSETEKGS
jgi:precorrin-2/cobalt-factor-2 C20-methyltransferase